MRRSDAAEGNANFGKRLFAGKSFSEAQIPQGQSDTSASIRATLAKQPCRGGTTRAIYSLGDAAVNEKDKGNPHPRLICYSPRRRARGLPAIRMRPSEESAVVDRGP